MELRDELAAYVAATLAQATIPPREVARRAYAVADAMLYERAELCFLDQLAAPQDFLAEPQDFLAQPQVFAQPQGFLEAAGFASDVEASYDPRWETEPRWTREDLARLDARRRGPGLAKPRDASPDGAKRTG
jgi:hypothetical protein